MAEWAVGPIMEKIISSCSDYLEDQFRWQTSMKKELERLRENHPKIQAVVDFASDQAQIRGPNLNKWIWQLRDAIDEADDLLDEFEYMKHKEQLTKNTEETKKRKVASFLFESASKIRKVGERFLRLDPYLNKLEEVVQKLDRISAEVGTFLHLLEITKKEQNEQEVDLYSTRETGSLPKNDLIGRGKDKEFVMQWLRKPSNEQDQTLFTGTDLYRNISILSIVGHGGMGKTTLLQHVYEDEVTKEFDLKMWVCVSNNFDVKKVIADMLESLYKSKYDLDSLDAFQGRLKSAVSSKKFLLVLDDIWEKEEDRDKSKWENVLAPLSYGGLGSKILVTTRMNSVALMFAKVINKKKETFRLEGLEEDECLQLLNTHAFSDVENLDNHKKLRFIAGEMVKKLSGSPLAAKVIGGVLNSNLDERHWMTILNSNFRSAKLGQNDIISILRLSYKSISIPLQNCFAFCCIFPEDHEFNKDDLVRMWIALGFIQPSHIQGETMEDIGGRYFDVLVRKSFFDKFQHEYRPTFYKMHDLLHELAQYVSIHECLRVVDNTKFPSIIPETIRHLSVKTENLEVLRKIINLKNVRTLYIIYQGNDQDFIDVLDKIFRTSRSIRLLCINFGRIKIIPGTIEYLIHLRYLRLDLTYVNMLPRSLSKLYHLQFMMVSKFFISSCFFLEDINHLTNLRYLELHKNFLSKIHGIGKLKSLQELEEFSLRNENGHRIGELEKMNDLRKLRINLLENVKDAEEACSAKLCHKRNLTDLSLIWGDGKSRNLIGLDDKVLDSLQPQNCLKNLMIWGYMGARSSIWMNNVNLISNLEYIKLGNFLELESLPRFGQLPFLKSLDLCNMPKVRQIDNKFHGNDKYFVFPSLEVLRIRGLKALEDWFGTRVTAKDDCLFPCLTELYLVDCPNLQELPYLPPKLKSLRMDKIGWKALNCCSISNSIPLEKLEVSCCPNISSLCLADEVAKLAALRCLTIKDCPNLISPGGHQKMETTDNFQLILNDLSISDPSVLLMEPLRSITCLNKLTIKGNNELISFPLEAELWFMKVSSSLCELNFECLKSLQSLHSSLESLSSLKTLIVMEVPQLQLLPNIPTSLKELMLEELESLQSLPSSLESLSSLEILSVKKVPQLQLLPNIPASLKELTLEELESLQSLPSSLESLSSLKILRVKMVPQLQLLPNIPASLERLWLIELESLQYLPSSLSTVSTLTDLGLFKIPLLKSCPNLPPSLCTLNLCYLDKMDRLPSCLPSLSSLQCLGISGAPKLRELPDLPPSLKSLSIWECHPDLKERYRNVEGSDWRKIAHIHSVSITTF